MKKLVPFKKELEFNTNVYEITNIALEHNLKCENDNLVSGEFIISGEYKLSDVSINTEEFEFKLPFDINIDDRYLVDNMDIDINDFYYELVNGNKLLVDIEVALDNMEEKIIEEEVEEVRTALEEEEILKEYEEEIVKLPEEVEKKEERNEEVKEPVSVTENKTGFVTYKIYIMKEEDTVEAIINKYNIEREVLEQYNTLNSLKPGDKIIIPNYD